MGRILIWDDNEDLRLALEVLIEYAGHEAVQAPSLAGVVRLGRERRPDVILIGLSQSGGGLQALQAVSAIRELRSVPIVVVSSWTAPENVALAKSLGVFAHIAKPWHQGEIELVIGLALASRVKASNDTTVHPSDSPIPVLAGR
ncbi:MAG: response regulator [Chloroflexi bacterium]|nr:response regulator [Chloroflexota bacterium]